jgi:hypothetical protein
MAVEESPAHALEVPPLTGALRTNFVARKDLGELRSLVERGGRFVLEFESGVEVLLDGDPASWLERMSAALSGVRPKS